MELISAESLELISAEGCDVVVHLKAMRVEAPASGSKLRAYALQEDGLDTFEANEIQGLPVDSREYGTGA